MLMGLLKNVFLLIPMLLSLTVHEFAHAWSAKKLGDDTAEREGRLTLNPIVHIDIFGTLILPLLGIPFGWAKPVPVNPARFRRSVNMRTGMMITAAAGPISNFLLAIFSAILLGVLFRFFSMNQSTTGGVVALILYAIQLNLALGIFNLLPIPPLDGSRVADRFMSDHFPAVWEFVTRFSVIFLIGIFILARFALSRPIEITNGWLMHLASTIAGA